MHLSSDEITVWQHGNFKLNATIVVTWVMMFGLTLGSHLVTYRLSTGPSISRWQSLLEMLVTGIQSQLRDTGLPPTLRNVCFVGSLFVFLFTANLLTLVPGYVPPTASLSTTAALALIVFVAVPLFAIRDHGVANYLRTYLRPTPIMLPLNILNEISRTLALAVRLFGNMMSGTLVISMLLAIVPLFFPILMTILGLITGSIQAYIFSLLAAVYLTAATEVQKQGDEVQVAPPSPSKEQNNG